MKHTCNLSLITLAILAPAASAEEIPHYFGDEIIVTATRFDAQSRVPANISVISGDEIRNSPALDLPDILKTRAGIDVRPLYGQMGIDATVDLRGFGDSAASNTLVLLDGQRLNPIDGGNINWSTVPLSGIQRIEIQRGAGTVLYGDRASGGVINIITDKSGARRASVSASAGSYGYRSLDASAGGGSDTGYANIFAHGASSDGWRRNSQQDQQSLSGRAGFYLEKGEVALDYAAYKESSGLPGYLLPDAYRADPRSTRTPLDTQSRSGYRLRPGVKIQISDAVTLEAEVSDEHSSQHWDTVSWGSVYDRDNHTQSVTPRLRVRHGLGGLASETVVGIDYYDGRVDARSSAAPVQWATQTSSAAYFQNSTALTSAWTVTLGGRSQRMEQRAHQDAYASWFTPTMDGSATRTRNAYDLGASYDGQGWRVYGKTGRTFRFANTDELFGLDLVTYAPVFAGDLRPQQGTLHELGGSVNAGPVKLRGAIYRLDMTDEIGYDNSAGANVNFDPTRRQGLEAEVDWQISERFKTRLAYAYSDAEFRDGPYAGKRVPIVPRNKASLQLTWDTGSAGSYSAVANAVGERIYSGDFSNSRGNLAGYATLDLLAAWDMKPWKVTARLLNALDKRYAAYAGYASYLTPPNYFYYPADGRSFALTVGYDFK
ncbi:TonB-dependent receptor [Sulfurimicrobium lacus]|uniref:TonB-dependent receptor n=1 Tax=Sulfurimicrobium lacus TaxID=2715678 RepID=A0A6F8VEF5_9PROT|nr:TonB-dependent receptor [Sulfurimicrobium lacus]BCB28064.1 TonB-dependent receptor [Sulfurimicrobium lacus]